MTEPGRRTNFSRREPKWLGSGIYTCGRCGAVMRVVGVGGTPSRPSPTMKYHYRCSERPHLTIHLGHTDEFVRAQVVDLVRDPRVLKVMTAGEGDAMKGDRDRRQVLLVRRANVEADYDADRIDGRRYKINVDKITAELGEVEVRLTEGAQAAARSPIFIADDPGAAFLDAAVDLQRAVLRSVLSVQVGPAAGRGLAWTPNRLTLTAL